MLRLGAKANGPHRAGPGRVGQGTNFSGPGLVHSSGSDQARAWKNGRAVLWSEVLERTAAIRVLKLRL